jgi:UDP-N-acetylglucosamine 2-epimerase (non-hydrolysing)
MSNQNLLKSPIKLAVILGTRPEAVKLAPVILGAMARPDLFEVDVISTGQHKEMLASMLNWFGIQPAVSLDIMKANQDLAHITMASLDGINRRFQTHKPDWVVVQGDTTTTFVGALTAFYHQVPVAHVEAGLRTHTLYSPFPEEANRVMTGHLATLHFPPTSGSRDNLLREGIPDQAIQVTGNTGIDALLWTHQKLLANGISQLPVGRRRILVTAHRRENHGDPMRQLCAAVLRLLAAFPDVDIHFPVHLSPKVREVVLPMLSGNPRVLLTDPLDYPEFVTAMVQSHLILTDSGGVQEEAPSLGKPVLVLRDSTERPEAIQAGTAILVGSDERRIVEAASQLLTSTAMYEKMARAVNPYGDGQSAPRILDAIAQRHLAR